MVAHFELVVDPNGRFQFQLFAPEGDVLLTGAPEKSKIMAQCHVQHAREALRDPARLVRRITKEGAHYCELLDRHDASIARSSRASSALELEGILARAGEIGAGAPLVDRTRQRPQSATAP